jgi:hypothetical protein
MRTAIELMLEAPRPTHVSLRARRLAVRGGCSPAAARNRCADPPCAGRPARLAGDLRLAHDQRANARGHPAEVTHGVVAGALMYAGAHGPQTSPR